MPRCRQCGGDLTLLPTPLEPVTADYYGPHDEPVQTVVSKGRGEGTVVTRYRHVIRWLCDHCHTGFTDDQISP